MGPSPFAPMRRLNVDVLLVKRIDPFGSIFATGEHERVDYSIIAQDADFEISVRWRSWATILRATNASRNPQMKIALDFYKYEASGTTS
jgi:hypothetical protein